jgi:hypothetical protein
LEVIRHATAWQKSLTPPPLSGARYWAVLRSFAACAVSSKTATPTVTATPPAVYVVRISRRQPFAASAWERAERAPAAQEVVVLAAVLA